MRENKEYIEEEIDLRNLFNLIWEKNFFILIFTAIVTILSLVYVNLKTPIYEVKTILEIGFIKEKNNLETNNTKRILENPNSLINRLDISYNINLPKKELTRLSNIKILKNSENLIELSIQSISNKKAKEYLNNIIKSIFNKHELIINNYLSIMNNKLENFKKELIRLEDEKILIQRKIDEKEISIKKLVNENSAVAAIYSMTLNANINEIVNLKTKIFDLKENISDIKIAVLPENIKKSEVLGEFTVYEEPIKPKKLLIIIVSFITSFILSIFIVLIFNFIRKV